MPACLTHYHFAKDVLAALPEKGEGVSGSAYLWGAQGPDFLFCHRYFPWMGEKYLRPYGNRLHALDPTVTLGALRDFLKGHDDTTYRSYAWGFLCHYALDSTAHPYINARARELAARRPPETPGTMHGEIEAALDAIVLRRETGQLPSDVALGKLFPKDEPVQRRVARLYRELIFQALGDDVKEDALYQATNDARLVFSAVTDRTGLKKKLFDVIERGRPHAVSSHIVPITERDDVDYANVQGEEWTADGETSHKSFFDLFDEALTLAVDLIMNFMDGDLAALTKGKTFG